MNKFDASIPRKMFWSTNVGGTDFCPQCHGRLENESHSYLLFVQERVDIKPFIVVNNKGYFCASCPVVVLDYEAFTESAIAGNQSENDFEFSVPGIVDLNAVPKYKKDMPLGEDDNPIPLVKFTNVFEAGSGKKKRTRGKLKGKKRNLRKIRNTRCSR